MNQNNGWCSRKKDRILDVENLLESSAEEFGKFESQPHETIPFSIVLISFLAEMKSFTNMLIINLKIAIS